VRLYADRPGTVVRQLLLDLAVLAWVYLWIKLATQLHDQVTRLATPGQELERAGAGMAENLAGAGDRLDNIPGVGNAVARPFDLAADAARGVATAGRQQQESVQDLALLLAVLVAAVPLALVMLVWLPMRARWVVRASAAARLRADPAGADLLALRALATQPLRRLQALDPQVAAAWRRGDQETITKLAALELRGLGLRPARHDQLTRHDQPE